MASKFAHRFGTWMGITLGCLALAITSLTGPEPAFAGAPRSITASASPSWLAEINRYRAAAGLNVASAQPAWDLGIEHHLTYLIKTPATYRTGQYASAHTENPASPYYTSDGAREAGYSDLALGGAFTALQAVDGWLQSPFHAVGMLRARLTQVALADDPESGYAGLDVIQGLDYSLPSDPNPILFPGPGVTTNLLAYGGDELPSPLQTCDWPDNSAYGLPLILLLVQPPGSPLTASLTGPRKTESTVNGELCVVDENTYHSTDPVYGPTGLAILQSDNAVFLIPRHPLSTGRYTVAVQQPDEANVDWSFSALAPITRTSIRSVHVHGHSIHIQIATPLGTHLRCALTRRAGRGFATSHFSTCWPTTIYRGLRRGRYRFTVHSRAGNASRQLKVP